MPVISQQELDNSLEYFRYANTTQQQFANVFDAAMYVLCKNQLNTVIPNPQDIIAYFDSKQESDGGWSGFWTRPFTTERVIGSYMILSKDIPRSLGPFFSNYATWPQVVDYFTHYATGDLRDAYHVGFAWCMYYWKYPGWLPNFWALAESDLGWTTDVPGYHKRTHILYTYVMSRRQFPNLDGIINATIQSQFADGSWGSDTASASDVYFTSIQLSLLSEILKIYPGYRTAQIQASINLSIPWIQGMYTNALLGGKTCGWFGPLSTIENNLLCGIFCAGQAGLLPGNNVDMSFSSIVNHLQNPSKWPVIGGAALGTAILLTVALLGR